MMWFLRRGVFRVPSDPLGSRSLDTAIGGDFQQREKRRSRNEHEPSLQGSASAGQERSELEGRALDLFLTRAAAETELEILEDEPDWKDGLRVVPIELDVRPCRRIKKAARAFHAA
jgi:hypothetical protein